MRSIVRLFLKAASLLLSAAVAIADPHPVPYAEVPELNQAWEIPLTTHGFVSVMPGGDKGVYLDQENITLFQVRTGKRLLCVLCDLCG